MAKITVLHQAGQRSGASGIIGTELASKSAPDGDTLLMGTTGTHATNPVVFSKLPYDSIQDFAPISNFVDTPFVLVVHPCGIERELRNTTVASNSTTPI